MVWVVSISFSLSYLVITIPTVCEDNTENHPHPFFISIFSFYLFLLLICITCHLYVYLVAHRHTQSISRTQRSHHASMQRLNSICIVNRDSLTAYHTSYLTTSINYPMGLTNESMLPVPVKLPQPSRPSSAPLLLLLPPLSLLLAWAPYLSASVLRLVHPCVLRQYSDQSFHLPLLFLASANPWIYEKLPNRVFNCKKLCQKFNQKTAHPVSIVVQMEVMARQHPGEETQQREQENSSLSESDGKNQQSNCVDSTMDLADMVIGTLL